MAGWCTRAREPSRWVARTSPARWGVIILMSGLPVVLLRPFQGTPFIDDGTYA
jgi:hypothetical protein